MNPKKKSNAFFHHLVNWGSLALLAGGLLVGVRAFFFYNSHEQTNDAQVEQYVIPVVARLTGYVQSVRFQENQSVKKGDTLLILDAREFQSRFDQADAEAAQADEGIITARLSGRTFEGREVVDQAKLESARAIRDQALQDLKRYQELEAQEAATPWELEKARTAYADADAKLRQQQKEIEASRLLTRETRSRIPEAGQLAKARNAASRHAGILLSYTVVTAPFDGVVGKRNLQPGQLVREGQSLLNLVSTEKWVTANFKETQIRHLKIGQEVTFQADAFPDHEFKGRVESFSPASGARFSVLPPDNATGNFIKIEQRIPVRIALDESDLQTRLLLAGMNIVVVAPHR